MSAGEKLVTVNSPDRQHVVMVLAEHGGSHALHSFERIEAETLANARVHAIAADRWRKALEEIATLVTMPGHEEPRLSELPVLMQGLVDRQVRAIARLQASLEETAALYTEEVKLKRQAQLELAARTGDASACLYGCKCPKHYGPGGVGGVGGSAVVVSGGTGGTGGGGQ